MPDYIAPRSVRRLKLTQMSLHPGTYDSEDEFTSWMVDASDLDREASSAAPAHVVILAYRARAGVFDFPTLEDFFSSGINGYETYDGLGGYTFHKIADPTIDPEVFYDDSVTLCYLRWAWCTAHYRARLLAATAFSGGRHNLNTAVDDDGPNTSMSYGTRRKKTEGAWFRTNELVRHNARLKTMINADATVISKMTDMLNIVKNIGIANGYTLGSTEVIATKAANAFPMTKQFWLGYLPFSDYSTDPATLGNDLYRKLFSQGASAIRERVTGLVRAFKLSSDAFNTADEANPGGQV